MFCDTCAPCVYDVFIRTSVAGLGGGGGVGAGLAVAGAVVVAGLAVAGADLLPAGVAGRVAGAAGFAGGLAGGGCWVVCCGLLEATSVAESIAASVRTSDGRTMANLRGRMPFSGVRAVQSQRGPPRQMRSRSDEQWGYISPGFLQGAGPMKI